MIILFEVKYETRNSVPRFRIVRKRNGGLHRRLSREHSISPRLSRGFTGLSEKHSSIVGTCERRVMGGHIRGHRKVHHARGHALAESAHARLFSGPEFTCKPAGRHAGRRDQLSWIYLGKNNNANITHTWGGKWFSFVELSLVSILNCAVYVIYLLIDIKLEIYFSMSLD